MARFGDLLRGLGSVLSPQVAQEVADEDKQNKAREQQMQMFALQNLVQDKRFQQEMAHKEKEAEANRASRNEIAKEAATRQALQFQQGHDLKIQLSEQAHEARLANARTAEERAAEVARHNKVQETLAAQRVAMDEEFRRMGIELKTQIADANGGQSKPPSGYRWKADQPGVLEPIPGGPATVQSPEQAAKTELLSNGIKDVGRYRDLVMKDGKIDRQIIVGMSVPGMAGVPGTNSRLAYSYIYNAIEAKLRAESGAAVPETEVSRMAKRFVPSPLDNDETIKAKVDRLEEFLGGSLGRVKGEPGAGVPKPSIEDLLKKYAK